jgi:hypothetical protein
MVCNRLTGKMIGEYGLKNMARDPDFYGVCLLRWGVGSGDKMCPAI